MKGKKKGCCIASIITFVVIIALLCVFLFVLTPNMFGLGETVVFNGQTINDLGLGDATVYNIIATIMSLTTPGDEHAILGDNVHTEKDLKSAANSLGLEIGSDGSVNYDAIIKEGASLNQTDQDVELNNKEFASVLNGIVQSSGKVDSEEEVEKPNPFIPEIPKQIAEEIKISGFQPVEIQNNVTKIEVTIGVDTKEILEKTGAELPQELEGVISDGMSFITKEVALKKTEDGFEVCLETETENLKINGNEIEIVNNLLHNLTVEDEHGNESTAHDELHDIIHDVVENLVNKLGVTDITLDGFIIGANLGK